MHFARWKIQFRLIALAFAFAFQVPFINSKAQSDSGESRIEECLNLSAELETFPYSSDEFLKNYAEPVSKLSLHYQIKSEISADERECLESQYMKMQADIKAQNADPDFETKKNVSIAMAEIGKALFVGTALPYPLVEIISDAEKFEAFKKLNAPVGLAELRTALLSAQNEAQGEAQNEELVSRAIELTKHTDGYVWNGFGQGYLNAHLNLPAKATEFLAEVPEKSLTSLSRLMVHAILRSAFSFTEKAKSQETIRFENNIAFSKASLRTMLPTSEKAKNMRAYIKEEERKHREHVATPVGLKTLRESLKAIAATHPAIAAGTVDEVFAEVSAELDEGYVYGDMKVKEGDAWAQFGFGGLGEVFAKLVRSPTPQTHSGVVVKFLDDGFPVYAAADISFTFNLSPMIFVSRTFMRPKFSLPENITERLFKNVEKFDSILFDMMYRPGLESSKNNAFLYCSEFVHFFYKNLLDPQGEELPSPFDSTDNSLIAVNQFAKDNIHRLGYDTSAPYFTPGNIVFSPDMSLIGVAFQGHWPADMIESEAAWKTRSFALDNWFFNDLQKGFESQLIRKPTASETLSIEIALRAGKFVQKRLPAFSPKIEVNLEVILDNTDLSSPSRHFSVLFLGTQNKVRTNQFDILFEATADRDFTKWLSLEWLESRYLEESRPQIESIFEPL